MDGAKVSGVSVRGGLELGFGGQVRDGLQAVFVCVFLNLGEDVGPQLQEELSGSGWNLMVGEVVAAVPGGDAGYGGVGGAGVHGVVLQDQEG